MPDPLAIYAAVLATAGAALSSRREDAAVALGLYATAVTVHERLDDPTWAVTAPKADHLAQVETDLARIRAAEDDILDLVTSRELDKEPPSPSWPPSPASARPLAPPAPASPTTAPSSAPTSKDCETASSRSDSKSSCPRRRASRTSSPPGTRPTSTTSAGFPTTPSSASTSRTASSPTPPSSETPTTSSSPSKPALRSPCRSTPDAAIRSATSSGGRGLADPQPKLPPVPAYRRKARVSVTPCNDSRRN